MTSYALDRRLGLAALLALSAPLMACGSDEGSTEVEGQAYLTIDGSSNVLLAYDGSAPLAVTYHDENDQPLAGKISFEIVGDGAGASLSDSSADADGSGRVNLQVTAARADASFKVRASAAEAAPVEWTVNVNQSGTLDVAGSYRVDSNFDVATGMPGTVGTVVNTIIDMTDSPNDPTTFILDLAVSKISNTTIKNLINGARIFLDPIVNDFILGAAPDFVTKMLTVADQLGQASRKIALESELAVTKTGETWSAQHTVTGYGFVIDDETYLYDAADIGATEVVINDIGVSLERENVGIAEHTVALKYGALLSVALEQVIIPAIDADAASLGDLLGSAINCADVGQIMADEIGLGSASTYEGVCTLGLDAAGDFVMGKLASIDTLAPVNFVMTGSAKSVDDNGDLKTDKLSAGKWVGNIDYNGTAVAMPADSKFAGERM